ncbi:zinc finger protein 629 [Etheostoma spectabile]|uniref:zinc finger protein 629 n=1 Tax=Etheostoma spectabile TaxID=54343 RepID=UPI0013AFE18C|nr:zinc finger protein 629-like [Etheostoma spectabile]
MLSSVALRAQIASIIDVLSKAAVAEIAKVVEDGVVELRLEMCQRENDIKKLKSNIEVLHDELRSLQERVTLRPGSHGRGDRHNDVGDERSMLEQGPADKGPNSLSIPGVQVKCEPVEEGSEEAREEEPGSYDRDSAQWRLTTQTPTGRNNSDYLNLGQNPVSCLPESSLDTRLAAPFSSSSGCQQSAFGRGLLGYSPYRNSYNMARRRTAKRLMFKKGFICPYCGKCFERAGHLERHKRIHTGEKPYRCEICGRRFNQKCSLKEHMKIHRRCIEPSPLEIKVGEEKPTPEGNPRADTRRTEEESQGDAEDGLPKNEDNLTTPVHVKSEPAENNLSQPAFHGGTEQTGDNLSENFPTFERDSQQWLTRLHGQNHSEISGAEYLGGSAFPGIAQLLPPPVEASCSTFSFPGKSYGELKRNAVPQTPYESPDTLLSSEAGLHGMAAAALSHHRPGTRLIQMIKPKKSFVCSYCGKVFERVGHLDRHLRIHTGEKPYGCHICGRCFNQKSSLKGHMKTHRNGENADVPEAHHLMFTMPDSQPLKNLAEAKTGLAASEEQFLGTAYGEAAAEQTVMVKLEPNGEDFQTQLTDNGTGAPGHRQQWTSVIEKSSGPDQTVCVLLHDAKYHLSPAAGAANGQQGFTSPIRDLPFLDDKEKEETVHNNQYSMMGMQSRSSDMTLAPELQDHHTAPDAAVNEYTALSDRTREGGVFEFNMSASGNQADNCDRQNCFICSSCGQSFDSFNLFQRHQCKSITEQSFSCEICGKIFNQMSILKLHLKLHV